MRSFKVRLTSLLLILALVALVSIASSPRLAASIQSGFLVLARTGNTNTYATSTGGLTNGDCASWDVNGNIVDSGVSGCGGSGTGKGGIVTYSGASLTFPSGTVFFPIGGGGSSSATETNVDVEAPSAATVANFYVQLSGALGVGNSVVFTWRKNAASTSLTCTISGNVATSCNDTTHSFNVIQGDLVDIQAVGSGTIVATLTAVMATAFGTTGSNGTVNTGTINQTAYYAAAGTALSGGGPGTSGQVWTSNGAGMAPSFQTAAAGGSTITIGAIASLPACSVAGTTYFTTDGYYTFVCDGTNNQPFHLGLNMQQPLSATFAAAGSVTGSPTATTTHGGIIFSASGGGSTVNYRAKSLANAAPYTVFLGIYLPAIAGGNTAVGISVRDSVTGKSAVWGYRGSTTPALLAATDSSITTTICTSQTTGGSGVPAPGMWYFKLQVDGSGNVLPFVASDRYGWVQDVGCNSTLTAILGAGVTPNQWGLAIESGTSAFPVSATWLDFSEVAGLH